MEQPVILFKGILYPFSDPEIPYLLFSIEPEDWCGLLKILKNIIRFCKMQVFVTPLIQIMWEGYDFDIVSPCNELFCFLAFHAVFQRK